MVNKVIPLLFSFWFFSAPSQALDEVAFFGRTYAMYQGMFCLSDVDVLDRSILDVPAGPSTFLPTLKERGILNGDSKAVDLLYGSQAEVQAAINRGMRTAFSPYFNGSYLSWTEALQHRFLSLFYEFSAQNEVFLRAYQAEPDLFVQGDIRHLDQTTAAISRYDLILSANLLFLYASEIPWLNETFHKDAILSMVSQLKSQGEIRIFPLDTFSATPPSFLEHLLAELRDRELTIEVKDGCAPSVGQTITHQTHLKGKMLVIRFLNPVSSKPFMKNELNTNTSAH